MYFNIKKVKIENPILAIINNRIKLPKVRKDRLKSAPEKTVNLADSKLLITFFFKEEAT
jgi:hypothetical protein